MSIIQTSNKSFGLVYNHKLILESSSFYFIFRMYDALKGSNNE